MLLITFICIGLIGCKSIDFNCSCTLSLSFFAKSEIIIAQNLTKSSIVTSESFSNESNLSLECIIRSHPKTKCIYLVFAATVNDSQVLTDCTGSRRFLCFETLSINYTTPVNHAGRYAQALALCRSGFKYWFSDTDINEINYNNEPFQQSSPEEELFFTYFRRPERFEAPLYLSSSEIVAKIAEKTRLSITTINVNNLGKMLKRIQFEQQKRGNKRVFCVIELTFDQVKANNAGIGYTLDKDKKKGKDDDNEDDILDPVLIS